MDAFKKHAHDSGITEDDKKQAEKDLQKLTDDYIAKIDKHLADKEKEIMTV
jgi:ribosome recycling factor